jgi:hypothetical protein
MTFLRCRYSIRVSDFFCSFCPCVPPVSLSHPLVSVFRVALSLAFQCLRADQYASAGRCVDCPFGRWNAAGGTMHPMGHPATLHYMCCWYLSLGSLCCDIDENTSDTRDSMQCCGLSVCLSVSRSVCKLGHGPKTETTRAHVGSAPTHP